MVRHFATKTLFNYSFFNTAYLVSRLRIPSPANAIFTSCPSCDDVTLTTVPTPHLAWLTLSPALKLPPAAASAVLIACLGIKLSCPPRNQFVSRLRFCGFASTILIVLRSNAGRLKTVTRLRGTSCKNRDGG